MAYEFGGLVAELRPFAELLLAAAQDAGLNPRITSTRRSFAEQKRLYQRYVNGTALYPVAPPGASAHEYGWAFDMDVVPHEALADVGAYWESLGGTWGGARDPVHFELPGASAAAKANYEAAGGAVGAPQRAESTLTKGIGAAADAILALVPGMGAVELAAALASLGFPDSEVAQFLSGPVEYLLAP